MYKLEIVVCLVENEASLAPRIKWNVDSSGLDQSIAQPLVVQEMLQFCNVIGIRSLVVAFLVWWPCLACLAFFEPVSWRLETLLELLNASLFCGK